VLLTWATANVVLMLGTNGTAQNIGYGSMAALWITCVFLSAEQLADFGRRFASRFVKPS
jgi:hypothetical protein